MALMKDRQNKGIEEDYLKKERPYAYRQGDQSDFSVPNDKLPQDNHSGKKSETHRQHRHQSFRVYLFVFFNPVTNFLERP